MKDRELRIKMLKVNCKTGLRVSVMVTQVRSALTTCERCSD